MSCHQAQNRTLLIALTCCASLCPLGCRLLFPDRPASALYQSAEESSAPERVTISLDVAVARRPVTDPLLKLIWDDVDEVGVLTHEEREQLNANGFRVGVAGSGIPSALQTMLRDSVQPQRSVMPASGSSRLLPGASHLTLFHGQDTLVEITGLQHEISFSEITDDRDEAELTSYENARCVFRVTVEKIQDGWVRVRFLPEIHHGSTANRPVFGDAGLQYKATQRIQPLYRYQFELTLNSGEVAIVGAADDTENRAGTRFFTTEEAGQQMRRLITIRFVETSTIRGKRQPTSSR